MEFKVMKREDLGQVAELYVGAFNGEPWRDKWTVETAAKRLGQMIGCEDSFGLIAYDEGKVVGMALGNKEYYYDCVHFHFKELCVDTTIKGKGIGSKLVAEMVRRLKEDGVAEILLWTLRCNEMLGFYEKQGFTVCNELMIMTRSL